MIKHKIKKLFYHRMTADIFLTGELLKQKRKKNLQ